MQQVGARVGYVGAAGRKRAVFSRYLFAVSWRTVKPNSAILKEGFVSDISSSVWRTAYFSAIFETDPVKLTLNIAGARAAITERLNSPIEISRLEHEAIEAARLKLDTLKAKPIEVVKLALVAGDTPI
jgi:hypothetical protein